MGTATAAPAVLYVHDGGEVSCASKTVGHSATLAFTAEANPGARFLRTERGTWERVTAEWVREWESMPSPVALPLRCETCGAPPLT